jgi:D-alanyl-D-alanine endopeptidase (penicillin-binding protein 7)
MRTRLLLGTLLAAALVLPSGAALARKKGGGGKGVSSETKDGWPNVQAKGAFVIDLDSGAELYEKDPDSPRAIASTTKIYVALVVRAHGLNLDGETEIIEQDKDLTRNGAKSRLLVGRRFKNGDLLKAMLVASDNRACTALGRAVGLDADQLVAEMNKQAKKLGLKKTTFTDPSGLHGNQSTPREMAIALRAALEDPLLAEDMSTVRFSMKAVDAGETTGTGKKARKKGAYAIDYTNTNVSLREGKYDILGGKTGYTDEARYCLVIGAKVNGRRVVMAFLGDEGKLTRFGDFSRVARWIEAGGPDKHVARGEAVGALADPPPAAVAPRLGGTQ